MRDETYDRTAEKCTGVLRTELTWRSGMGVYPPWCVSIWEVVRNAERAEGISGTRSRAVPSERMVNKYD